MFIEVIIAFQIHESGRDHTVTVTFDKPIQGEFEGIYTANNRLAIMERSVYVYALPDEQMAFALENVSRVSNRFFCRFLAKNIETGDLFTL